MSPLKILVNAFVIGCFSAQASVALAQDDSSIYGTHSVVFQPVQVGGELQGCQLVFRAVQADYVYLGGNPVVVVGSIGFGQRGAVLALTMKIGVKELSGNHPFVRPNFAYLQTKSHSTAKVKQQVMDGDEGFRLFVYPLSDSPIMELLREMIDTGKVTVAFNRRKNGMDVLIPVDFDVIDAEYPEGDKVVRTRTQKTLLDFTDCLITLTNQAKRNLSKK